jgi:hypothetical protein
MATLEVFQSFSPVTQSKLMPSQELVLWMMAAQTLLTEAQTTLEAVNMTLANHESRLAAGGL